MLKLINVFIINLQIFAYKYGRTMKVEAADVFFEQMKKKMKTYLLVCGLFVDKNNSFIGVSHGRLMTCDCC